MTGTAPTWVTLGDQRIPVAPGQNILDALEGAGVAPPASCRSGTCQTCAMRCVDGAVPAPARHGLGPGLLAQGAFLPCICTPDNNLTVEFLDTDSTALSATLHSRERRGDTLLLGIHVPGLQCVGGQFIHLLRDDGLRRPYSVAGVVNDVVELHVTVMPGGAMSTWLDTAPLGSTLKVLGPAGECVYMPGELDRPLILAGLGTGLAPILGVLRDALAAGHNGPLHVYVGARSADDLYLAPELRKLAAAHDPIQLQLGALHAGDVSDVAEGPLEDKILANDEGLSQARVYLCGAPSWVQSVQMRLFLAGASLGRIHADSFVSAPPPPCT